MACIEAIGAYRKEHLVPLVVCSRQAEYEEIRRQKRLVLQSAVVVQPLTQEQVDAYLLQTDQSLASVRAVLDSNEVLRDLTTTPLMLNVLTQTYEGATEQALSLQGTADEQQRQVLAAYVERMVQSKGDEERYPLEYTRSRLGWLARQMRERNQTVFYLEHLQPDWLTEKQRDVYMLLGVRLPAIVIGILASVFVQSFLGGDTHLADLFGYGVLGGYLGWLWSVPMSQESVPSSKRALRSLWGIRLIVSVFIGLLFGILIGPYYGFGAGWRGGLIFGISMGLSSFLLQLLFAKETQGIGSTTVSSTQQVSRLASFLRRVHIRRVLLVAVVFGWSYGLSEGLSYGLSINLSESLSKGLSIGLSYGLMEGLRYGLISMLISLVRVSSGTIYLTERLRWTWGSLKRSLFLPRHIFVTLFLACLIMILSGVDFAVNNNLGPGLGYELIYGLGYGLSEGLVYGLSYWFLFGLFQGIAHERIEDQDRLTANQGIKRSLFNSIIMGATSGWMIGVAGILSTGLNYGLNDALIYNLGIAWSFDLTNGLINGLSGGLPAGLSGGCFVLLISGGLAVLRHYVIRFLLWRSRIFPWRAVAFLDDATVRGLLRRVGGGYSFSHRLLLDYLADQNGMNDSAGV